VFPAGTCVRGGPPSHTGWIELEDEEGWALDDGSWALRVAGRPAEATRFRKTIAVPSEAVLSRATKQQVEGELIVRVPRRANVSCQQQGERSEVPVSVKAAAAAPPPTPTSPPLTKEALFEIQHECMADDLDITPEMLRWTEAEVRRFFESGGNDVPTRAEAAPPIRSVPSAAQQSPPHKPPPAKRAAPSPAAASPENAKSKASVGRSRRGGSEGANQYDKLLPTEEPVLMECSISTANVQLPAERSQEWEATKNGGFVRTA